MKNKGRRHLATDGNCKGFLTFLTRDISKNSRGKDLDFMTGVSKKFMKKKWSKRVRGYFKSQVKDVMDYGKD